MKSMHALYLAATLALAGLAGCSGPIPANQDPMTTYPQVHMTSYWLQTWTRVQAPIVHRVGSGQLDVAVPIRNRTDDELIIDYQYRFLRGGVEAEQRSGWHNLRIPRKGMAEIHFTSMTPNVDDFDLDIRYRE